MFEPYPLDHKQLSIAADLLAEHTDNPYLIDAAGYARRARVEIVAEDKQNIPNMVMEVVHSFGNYGAQTEHADLADHAFAVATLQEKWRLFGSASLAGTIDRHADWGASLDSDEMQNLLDQDKSAQAAMWSALTVIALADYSATPDNQPMKSRSLEIALARKAALFSILERRADTCKDPISPEYSEALREEMDVSFARLGMWHEVEVPRYHHAHVEYLLPDFDRLLAKAITGGLDGRDVRRIKQSGCDSAGLLDVNDLAQGIVPAGIPRRQSNDGLHWNRLLPAVAPAITVKLGVQVEKQIDLQLRAGNPEQALSHYVNMQNTAKAADLLDAALLMARHHGDLQAATAAHDVYNRAFGDRLETIRSYVTTQDWQNQPEEVVAVTPIITELDSEIDSLNDPEHQLVALARTLAVQLEVDPTSTESRSCLRRLIQSWDAIELMDSYHTELPKLATTLKGLGIRFHRQWKLASSTSGYVGYTLTAADLDVGMSVREADRLGDGVEQYVKLSELGNWQYAAQCLNEIYGEDRYVVTARSETRKGEGTKSAVTYRRVLLSGTWQQSGHPIGEFYRAKDKSWLIKGSINTLFLLSERLRLLYL
jgi:hypothetical protein